MDIFLSASIPLPTRNRAYYDSVDLLALREAIKALADHVLPTGRITFGGHPAITPLIAAFARQAGLDRDKLTLFQSQRFDGFQDDAPPIENSEFGDVREIPGGHGSRADDLTALRHAMISSKPFDGAVFIGGMEGCLQEYEIFRELHAHVPVLPLATTGAAARKIFNRGGFAPELGRNRTYPTLFRRLLPNN